MDMFDEKVDDNEGLELDRFIYLMGELIENIFVHRSMCKVMGYNMDTVDGFIAKKWAIEKDRFDKMTVEELCRIIGEDTRRREEFFDSIRREGKE